MCGGWWPPPTPSPSTAFCPGSTSIFGIVNASSICDPKFLFNSGSAGFKAEMSSMVVRL